MGITNKVVLVAMLCLSINVSAANREVDSREYKLLLNTHLFTGNELIRTSKVNDYWKTLKRVIKEGSLKSDTSGSLSLDKNRTISFYDVQGSCDLFNAGYSFRERVENDGRKVTLKFRSADQPIANAKDIRGKKSNAKSKFEEDISAPFISTYSSSTTQKIGKNKNLNKMDDPVGLYPGLKSEHFDESIGINKVSHLTVSEYVYKNATADLDSVDAEFSLTLWYNEAESKTQAIVAEISFKYKGDHSRFSDEVGTRAKALFIEMQTSPQLINWNSPDSLSKTATIYQYDHDFCI